MFHVPEQYRIKVGGMASDKSYGNVGAFTIRKNNRTTLWIVASNEESWEHVSVHCVSERKQRTPTWAEMCYVKDIFWDETDCVIQYHPPKSEYVNMHKHTLHLWRPIGVEIPMPDKMLV